MIPEERGREKKRMKEYDSERKEIEEKRKNKT